MDPQLQWYVQRDGKASGPFSIDDLKNQVKQGLLLGHDLVYSEGTEGWKRAFDFPQLAAEIFSEERVSFTRLFTLPRAEEGTAEDWIVLIRFEEGRGWRFSQEGPYSTERVRELLKDKKAKPSDHVWKKGFEKWVPIYLRDEFSSSLWNVKEASLPLLSSVVEPEPEEFQPDPVSKESEGPAALEPLLAAGEELAERASLQAPQLSEKIPSSEPKKFGLPPAPINEFSEESDDFAVSGSGPRSLPAMPPTREPSYSPTTHAQVLNRPSKTAPYKWLAAALAVLGLFFVSRSTDLISSHLVFWNLHKPVALAPEEVVSGEKEEASTQVPQYDDPEADASTADQSQPVASAPKIEKPIVAKKEEVPPPLNVKSKPPSPLEKVLWVIKVPAETGSSLVATVTGASGQVLDVPAVNMRLNYKLPASHQLVFDPKQWQLPEGEYVFQVFGAGKLLAKSEKDYIADPQKFEKRMFMHRKQIAFDQQEEKRNLIKSLDSLQRFLQNHRSEITRSSVNAKNRDNLIRKLEALVPPEVKKSHLPRNALMYPSGWAAYGTQFEVVRNYLQSGGARGPAAKQDFDAVRKKISNLRSQVSQTSIYRE